MAAHFRRKQLLKNLNTMYLDNYQRSKTYSDQVRLENYMRTVTEVQLAQVKDQAYRDTQLSLF